MSEHGLKDPLLDALGRRVQSEVMRAEWHPHVLRVVLLRANFRGKPDRLFLSNTAGRLLRSSYGPKGAPPPDCGSEVGASSAASSNHRNLEDGGAAVYRDRSSSPHLPTAGARMPAVGVGKSR